MDRPWDRNCGHQNNENLKSYQLFKVYLGLGFQRNIRATAEASQTSYHNIYSKFKHFNWFERAESFDQWVRDGGDPLELQQDVAPLLPATVREYQSSKPYRAIDVQVINDRLNDLSGLVHEEKMKEYAEAYEKRGKKIYNNGEELLEVINSYITKIRNSNEKQDKFLADQNYVAYVAECKAAEVLVNQYCKLWGALQIADVRAREDWGDSIGVKQLLEAMYAPVR